ncbi:hypothetical protein E2C01_054663 [Portunus trituberculatus]|uniref:Uncharacterized protein n=1 Tax=Portunus trituberculatus TaxID=210409 RepID=A0A5B7GK89_PORTR|nr:hypothetical protein [Portunus trituberculatus]
MRYEGFLLWLAPGRLARSSVAPALAELRTKSECSSPPTTLALVTQDSPRRPNTPEGAASSLLDEKDENTEKAKQEEVKEEEGVQCCLRLHRFLRQIVSCEGLNTSGRSTYLPALHYRGVEPRRGVF